MIRASHAHIGYPRCAIAILTAALLYGSIATGHAQSGRIDDVRIGRLGDRWLDTLRFQRIERATQSTPDGQRFGYAVTYQIPDHGEIRLFWPRSLIDFTAARSAARSRVMRLRAGRLFYPERITARSLPAVHRGILRIEGIYRADARGATQAMNAFMLVFALGSSVPTLRATPARPPPSANVTRPSTATAKRARRARASTSGTTATGSSTTATATAAGTTTAARTSTASSKALARALERAGHVRSPGAAAHHIVAGSARKARESRNILRRVGIDINDATNGVFLPATKTSANPTGASIHSTLHTDDYYSAVTTMLEQATTRKQVESVLQRIRQMLLKGAF